MANKDYSGYTDEELMQIAQQSKPGLLERAGNIAGKFNNIFEASRIPAFAGGLLQGVGDVGASLGNVIARPLGHPIPHPNLGQYVDNSLLSRIAFGAGGLASQVPLYSSGAGLIGKMTGLGEKAGLSGRALQGAISGALMGENEEGDRLQSAALGASIPVAGTGIQKAIKLRPKSIANDVVNAMKNTEQKYKAEFNNVFKSAESRPYSGEYHPIDYNDNLLKQGGNKKYLYALEKYNQNPTLESAHNAQSELGKYIRAIGKPSHQLEKDAKTEAQEIAESLRDHIITNLDRSGNPDLASAYINARHGYKSEYVPYLESKSIQKFIKNELTPKDFAKEIAKEMKFKAQVGRFKHPEIHQREVLGNIAKSKAAQYGIGAGIATALGGAGLYGLAKLFK